MDREIPFWSDTTCGSLPENLIGRGDTDLQRPVLNFDVCDTRTRDVKVSAKLPYLGIPHDRQLLLTGVNLLSAISRLQCSSDQNSCCKEDVEGDTNCDANFHPKFYAVAAGPFLVIFIILFGKGI